MIFYLIAAQENVKISLDRERRARTVAIVTHPTRSFVVNYGLCNVETISFCVQCEPEACIALFD